MGERLGLGGDAGDDRKAARQALVIAGGYGVLGVLWIVGSELVLASLLDDPRRLAAVQTWVGWAFVAASSAFIFAMAFAGLRRRVRTEHELRSRNETLGAILDSAPLAVLVLDTEGRLQVWNNAAERVFGWTGAEVVGSTRALADILGRRMLADLRARLLRGETVEEEELRFRRRDRSIGWVVASAALLRDGRGELSGLVCMAADVSARVEAEKRIRFQASLLDAVGQAVVATGLDGAVLYWNRAAELLYGWRADEVMGRSVKDVIPIEIPYGRAEERRRRLAAGREWSGEFEARRKDGEWFPVYVTDAPLLDPEERPIGRVGISSDVSERKKLERQLQLSQRLEAVGRLAGGIAHDFNNLLTGIDGFSQLVLEELPEDSPLRDDMAEIRRSAARAMGLTRQLLAFSRQQVLQPRVLNLNEIILPMEKMLRRLIGEDIELLTDLHPRLRSTRVDPGQMEQVLMNLVVNARDAMAEGGRITIGTANTRLTQEDARQFAYRVLPGEYVRLQVRDTGTGIDPDDIGRIFEPFFTTKPAGKGTGLGLSTVYGIVKQSDGYVWVESHPGKGTIFSIYLPRVSAPVTREPVQRQAVAKTGTETVLLVEDDAGVRSLAARVLRRNGYSVLEAADGPEALRIASSEPIDLVLTDMVMPQMSGSQLVARLRAQRPDVKVLYMSGYTDDPVVRREADDAPERFLPKPFTAAVLSEKVRNVLDNA